jgi:microcystin degradation protein MlrC
MTIQAITNGNQPLADTIAKDMARFAWRQRDALLHAAKVYTVAEGVATARQAIGNGETPVVLADHSDRSGYATWLLQEVIAQHLSRVLIATVADQKVTARLKANDVKPGDAFDMDVGGMVHDSAGPAVRIQGMVAHIIERRGRLGVCVKFGRDNMLVISPYLLQIMEPSWLACAFR